LVPAIGWAGFHLWQRKSFLGGLLRASVVTSFGCGDAALGGSPFELMRDRPLDFRFETAVFYSLLEANIHKLIGHRIRFPVSVGNGFPRNSPISIEKKSARNQTPVDAY
jgi:hypothetical protein